jgi:hypothetical protein
MATILSWREADLASVAVAGLVAGYVMAVIGLWAGSLPFLVSIDIADFGRRYMVSDRPSAWIFGLAAHLTNSVLLTLAWASVIAPNVAAPQVVSAVAWGLVLAIVLAGALVAPFSGLGFLGRKTGNPRFAVTNLAMHTAWGILVGLLYTR